MDKVVERFFEMVVHNPIKVIIFCLLLTALFASSSLKLTKDTRADAFLSPDNPALLYRDKVKKLFGLSDPVVIAIIAEPSIFSVEGLNFVKLVSDMVGNIEYIDPEGLTSLATEKNIASSEDGIEVYTFVENKISTQDEANEVRQAIQNFPLYQGSLVSNDGSATLVLAEILDDANSELAYTAVINALENLEKPEGLSVHIAGEGAIAGYLGRYIYLDGKRLNPIAALIITLIVFMAFLRISTALLVNIIIFSSIVIAMGAMAMSSVPFYVITNALPVILIGISVADSLHIYSKYYELRALQPEQDKRQSIVKALMSMWRPVTLTTLTTAAGFMGLYIAAYMPPFRYFGLFAAVGVFGALFYSLIFLPAVISLLKTEVNQSFARKIRSGDFDIFARMMVILGGSVKNNSFLILSLSLVVVVLGLLAASFLRVDSNRIDSFHPSEPLHIAHSEINKRFNGTNYIDIVVETERIEGLNDIEVLKKMEALQEYALTLPHVTAATSIIDYLKQMNQSLLNGNKKHYILPQDESQVAQYLLLYSASGSPTDFEEEIDYDYRFANIRIVLNKGSYIDTRDTVESLENYIKQRFNDGTVKATLSGRVSLNYQWIKGLGHSHFSGMGLALLLVALVTMLMFRSISASVISLIPVALSVLFVYATMVVLSIPLGISTSMFAAVAIGLGVDFSIHTLERFRSLFREHGCMDKVFTEFYPSIGRTLFFNLLAIVLGFGVLISSKVIPLNNFGAIVVISVTASFIFSLTLVPTLIMKLKPSFITNSNNTVSTLTKVSLLGVMLVFFIGMIMTQDAKSASMPDALEVVEKINNVDRGKSRKSHLVMTLTDSRGKVKKQTTKNFMKYFGNDKKTVFFYLEPKNVKNTAFLTFDYAEQGKDDDQWLYLPALRKPKRISTSGRGRYFLGTDFTYEDIKNDGKFEKRDYDFELLGEEKYQNRTVLQLKATPKDKKIAKELGYGKVLVWVDQTNWQVVHAKYWDKNMNLLKILDVNDIRLVDGIVTRHKMKMKNIKTGHQTEFIFSDITYNNELDNNIFRVQALARGVR